MKRNGQFSADQLTNIRFFGDQWERLRKDQPTAVTSTLDAWYMLKMSVSPPDAIRAATAYYETPPATPSGAEPTTPSSPPVTSEGREQGAPNGLTEDQFQRLREVADYHTDSLLHRGVGRLMSMFSASDRECSELRSNRDEWQQRYQLLKAERDLLGELLHSCVVDHVKGPAGATVSATLYALLEEGEWRAKCAACWDVSCLGCADDATDQRATERLEETYDKWRKMPKESLLARNQ